MTDNKDVTDKLKVKAKQGESSCDVKIGDSSFSFWKYDKTGGLRANINASQEVYFGSDNDVRKVIAALTWYLENKQQVPELVRVRGRGTGRVLYGVRPEEAQRLVDSGKAYRQDDSIVH